MKFQFIGHQTDHHGTLNSVSRREVRRHVMKGRHTGRSHTRGCRRAAKAETTPRGENPEDDAVALCRWAGDGIAAYSKGTSWTPHENLRIRQYFFVVAEAFFPQQLCHSVDIYKTLWFQALFIDEAYFHAFIAMANTCANFFQHRSTENSPKVCSSLSRTFQLMNKKLSGKDALSDMTIGLTALLTVHETLRGDLNSTKIHLDGLQRMITLRGGIETFRSSPSMLAKFARADIEYSLESGAAPRFSMDGRPQILIQNATRGVENKFKHLLDAFPSGLLNDMPQIVLDVLNTNHIFNHGPVLDALEFQSIVLSLVYRLIQIDQKKEALEFDPVNQGWHFGMMAFATSFLFQFGRRRNLRYVQLARRVRACIDRLYTTPSCPDLLILWLLFIGSVSFWGDESDHHWLLPAVARAGRVMGLSAWEEVRGQLATVPWVHSVHDDMGRCLWEKSRGINF